MVLQNRVTPEGEIIATAARGLLMGNRGGRLHDPSKQLAARRWVGKTWIYCRLAFKERRREVMGPGYTELFFLDEATALGAGHRPCFECRRAAAVRFAELWNVACGRPGRAMAGDMDSLLHAQRLTNGGAKGRYRAQSSSLPDGTMVANADMMGLWHQDQFWPWTPRGYLAPEAAETWVDVLTPAATVAVLAAGYRPMLHGLAVG